MANPYYAPGEQRGAKVGELFAAIAPRYDLLNDLQSFGLHRLWKRRLVRRAQPRPGERALDVCCGTGDLALALAREGAVVTGVDFCEPMLAIARGRSRRQTPRGRRIAARRGHLYTEPEFVAGDALRLAFADGHFGLVTVGYGLRNLASWEGGIEEMWRVLGLGGRLLVLEFGKPSCRVWRRVYFAYLRRALPPLGRLVSGNAAAYAYILTSLEHYPAPDGVQRKLAALGARTRTELFFGGVMTLHCGRKL
ncbi:MAG: ubiquinone/menaquinone biosynthesis methyltransferase [Verrucomicrobia bacterium]|nr:ubiquinone/menaquinone biosynthesis methyltransferase [Verrucomicrobiota bacterium]